MSENAFLKQALPQPMKAMIGEWHSYHLESNSRGEAVMVTDGYSADYFKVNPEQRIMTREDGTWGPDPKSTLILTLPTKAEELGWHLTGVCSSFCPFCI